MRDILSNEANLAVPQHEKICEILSNLNPDDPAKRVSRAFEKAWPAWKWQIKGTGNSWYLDNVGVIDVDGKEIAADARLWFTDQLNLLGQQGLIDLINQTNLRLIRCEGDDLYLLGVNNLSETNFAQVKVCIERRSVCSLQGVASWHFRHRPDDYPFAWDHAEKLAPKYKCAPEDIINSIAWLDRCKISHAAACQVEFAQMQKRVVTQSFLDGTPVVTLPFLDAFPSARLWQQRLSREERWFRDWNQSSAGNHPMGRFWYLKTHDYTDRDDTQHVGFIPQAVIWPKQKIRVKNNSVWQLMAKIDRFDRAVRHKFGWYFYMVHGNLITLDEGKVVADGVRRGHIYLEPRDQDVLLAWADDPYCF